MQPADHIPRKEFHEFPPEVATRLDARIKRLGYLGEFFRCAVHQPEALAAFIDFTEAGKGSLPPRIVEIIALTCAGFMGNAYERNQHERLSVRLGFGREWVAAVNARNPEKESALAAEEQRVQRLVLEILETHGRSDDARRRFREMTAERGAEQATAILMVIGRYLVHAIFVNTLNLAPPVPSIFEDGFSG